MNRHLKSIELDKILEMLAAECQCEESLTRAAGLRPSANKEYVHIFRKFFYCLIKKKG